MRKTFRKLPTSSFVRNRLFSTFPSPDMNYIAVQTVRNISFLCSSVLSLPSVQMHRCHVQNVSFISARSPSLLVSARGTRPQGDFHSGKDTTCCVNEEPVGVSSPSKRAPETCSREGDRRLVLSHSHWLVSSFPRSCADACESSDVTHGDQILTASEIVITAALTLWLSPWLLLTETEDTWRKLVLVI